METSSANIIEGGNPARVMKNSICPALILGKKVMCDAFDQLHHPGSRQIRECCTNENHIRCLLQIADPAGRGWADGILEKKHPTAEV